MDRLAGVLLIITGCAVYFLTEDNNVFAGLVAGVLWVIGGFKITI